MAAEVVHVYRYAGTSEISLGDKPSLTLATSGGTAEHPFFFRGYLTEPRVAGGVLRSVARVVGSRFYTPPAMLARILREADPVVTSGGGMLRFEGFSACASAYARADFAPASYDASELSPGTTNVDFNAPMRAALTQLREGDRASLSVGRASVELELADTKIVERRVPLPLRWLRGFVEVQAYQARMEPVLEVSGPIATRFFRSLPRSSAAKTEIFVAESAGGLRAATRSAELRGARHVRVAGLERLRVVEELAATARRLRVYADQAQQASAWELDFGSTRFTLVLSHDVWRGFSGEGQALSTLAAQDATRLVASVRAELAWQARLDLQALRDRWSASEDDLRRALTVLGTRGLVGFDTGQAAYFHRELPYDLEQALELQPRLTAAQEILRDGRARVTRKDATSADIEIAARGPSGVPHHVKISFDATARCSCPWFAKHRGERGPCKHVLAAQILLESVEA